ncbi:MAG: PIG-L deacetylase family protein [Planctomycetaceae bacterium]
MSANEPRLLILGAHPDDAEFHAGGIASVYRSMGREVKMVSVTDGGAGHHTRSSSELVRLRRNEAAAAGNVIGAVYETWDFPDGALQASLAVRHRIIREIRQFKPDLVLTHRPNDYHPDHRAVGQCVQDASYLVKVPLIVPDVPALRRDPVVAYMPDLFTKPQRMQPEMILNIAEQIDTIVAMLACHASQVFEWLAYEQGILDTLPADQAERMLWLKAWYTNYVRPRVAHFQNEITHAFGDAGSSLEFVEAFEISEYALRPDAALLQHLFPNCRTTRG